MIKEAASGAAAALVAVLIWQGVNVAPLVLFAGLVFLLFHFAGLKGGTKKFAVVESGKSSGLVDFTRIGGQQTAKKELLEALDFIRHPEQVAKLGIRPLKGILLVGPPGTGKTLLARAAAKYTESVFLASSGSEFIEMYAGVGAQRVRQLFEKARSLAVKEKKKSAIIFIDEIEILGGKRGSHSSHLEYDQTLNQLLVEMDGMSLDDRVRTLLIGATNRSDMLDGALIRPGRFDRIVQVDLPDLEARLEILKLHTENKPLAPDVDLERLARDTFGFSGAHLESLANEAAILAMRENMKSVAQRFFNEAIDKVIMGERLERRPDREELWRVAVHEMGHAIVSEDLTPGSVSTITTTSRGKALGYMRQTPQKDSYLYTKDDMEIQIAVCLGGAVAEEMVLGERSTGAANDFKKAVEDAKKIIAAGMSPLGVVSLEDLPRSLLHRAVKKLISIQEERVFELIGARITLLKELAEVLVAQEKISGEYLRRRLSEGFRAAV
jgi:vesicle-fusing ATPase